MKIKHLFLLTGLLSMYTLYTQAQESSKIEHIQEYTTDLYDTSRERIIPVAIYSPKNTNSNEVVIFNHGYDKNSNPEACQSYAYLTRFLAEKGYYVISIQHELPDDPLLAMEGEFMVTRMPNWRRGMENILFVIHEFKKLRPELNWNNLSVIGHSNGGDMSMLLAMEHPELIAKVISMDHRRMIMPRTGKPRIYTLRGCDYDADPGVIPATEELQKYKMTVVKLDGITHSDMGERGTGEQHDTIAEYICNFLKE